MPVTLCISHVRSSPTWFEGVEHYVPIRATPCVVEITSPHVQIEMLKKMAVMFHQFVRVFSPVTVCEGLVDIR